MSSPPLSDDDWRALRDVARGLQYFALNRNYTFIDRIADAFSPSVAVAALRDAVRVLSSEASRGLEAEEKIHVPRASSVERVIRLLQKYRGVGDILAALALSSWPRREGGERGHG